MRIENVIGKLAFLSFGQLVAYEDDDFWQFPQIAYPLVVLFVVAVLFSDVLFSRFK